MNDILTGTPPELTYLHPMVREAWIVVWGVASGALIVILGWMGLSLIMQNLLGHTSTGWRETVPRLVLGLVAAVTSYWWCALVIDVAHTISKYIAAELDVTPGDLLRAPLETFLRTVEAGSVGMAQLVALLYVVYGFFVLYVLVQLVLRLALIDILLALAPIALGLWILPHTAGWGRHWLRLFLTTVFQQSIQLIALALGFGFLREYAAMVCTETVWAAAARDPKPRLLVVDEVWSIMQHPEGAAFMVSMAKRARKHRLGLQFITQDVQGLLSEDTSRTITGHSGRALLQNAAFKLLLQQDAAAISTVGEAFDLPQGLQKWLLSCPRGDGLLLARGNRFPVRIEATPEEAEIIEWRPGSH